MESRSSVIKNVIVGAVIGVTSMLPGISGATMAVVFGIYERLIRDVANLKTYLIKDFGFFLAIAVGALAGMLVCAKVLKGVLDTYPVECLLFFIGLIAGQLIPLTRDVKKESNGFVFSNGQKLAFCAGLAMMVVMVIFTLMSSGTDVEVGHDVAGIAIMFLVGVIVAISAILPGLSHSTILLVFGLMNAFLAVVGDMDFVLLAPMGIGAVVGAIGFAKIFQKALELHHLTAMMFIFGLTIGSVAVIAASAVTCSPGVIDVIIGAVLLMLGLFISVYSDRAGKKTE